MMDRVAKIIVTRHEVYQLGWRETYEWEGKKHWPVRVSGWFLDDCGVALSERGTDLRGKDVQIGPYPLRIVDFEAFACDYVCFRTDVGFGLRPVLYLVWQRIYGAVMWVWWRVVATLKVWGLIKLSEWEK